MCELGPRSVATILLALSCAAFPPTVGRTLATETGSATPIPLHQLIDSLVERSHVGPLAPAAGDFEFLRRLTLDLAGRIPRTSELQAFTADTQANKRTAAIDRLLDSDEFTDHAVRMLDVMLMERRGGIKVPQEEWLAFLRQAVEQRWSFARIVRHVLTATGQQDRGPAKFLLERLVEPNALTRDIGRLFLGRDLQCAQCHDHPNISDYAQAEYYGILAFVNRCYMYEDEQDNKKAYVGEKATGEAEFQSVFFLDEAAQAAHPNLQGDLRLESEPTYTGSDAYLTEPGKEAAGVPRFSRRAQLARLLTHRDNRQFAKNIANRFWAHMFGRGLVHPVDFHHADNPPSHPALLDALATSLADSDFDYRQLLRQIALSQTYQRSIDFPTTLATTEAVQGKVAKWQAELNAMQKSGSDAQPNSHSRIIEQLETRRTELGELARQAQELATDWEQLEKQRQQHEQASVKQTADITGRQQQLQRVQQAGTALTAAIEGAPKDEALKAAGQSVQKRIKQLHDALAKQQQKQQAAQQEDAARTKQQQDLQQQLRALHQRQDGLAEVVAELRGAARVFQREQDGRRTRRTELQQRLAAAELTLRLLAANAKSAEALGAARSTTTLLVSTVAEPAQPDADAAKDAASEAANAQRQNAEAKLHESWQRRAIVRTLKPLTPEQLAGATITALGLDSRYRNEAEAEWTKQQAKAKAEQDAKADSDGDEQAGVDKSKEPTKQAAAGESRTDEAAAEQAAKRSREIEKLYRQRIERVYERYVALFAAPGGAPQDVFSATADQALFLSNDGRVQGWLSPAKGTLVKRLLDVDDSVDDNRAATELYLAILSRPATDEEQCEVVRYLASRKKDRRKAIAEIVWALLASLEFRFNH